MAARTATTGMRRQFTHGVGAGWSGLTSTLRPNTSGPRLASSAFTSPVWQVVVTLAEGAVRGGSKV